MLLGRKKVKCCICPPLIPGAGALRIPPTYLPLHRTKNVTSVAANPQGWAKSLSRSGTVIPW